MTTRGRIALSPSGAALEGAADGQILVWNARSRQWVASSKGSPPKSPVFVEQYLPGARGDIRTAIRSAWLDNPDAGWFLYPSGTFDFVGPMLTLADGFRNGVRHTGQNTELRRDLGGVPSGQQIFFYRSETDARHGAGIVFEGFQFSLLNALTSFFGFAIGIEAASDCILRDCFFRCTLVPNATSGRIRWGAALFGGDPSIDPTAGSNNRFERNRLTLSQLQGCALGRSINGVLVSDTLVESANDWAISVVTRAGCSVQNVLIRDTICRDVGGSGVVFAGGDGTDPGAAPSVVRNVRVSGVLLDGQRNPNLDFEYGQTVLINGGVLNENVFVSGVGTSLSPNATFQAKSILIQSNGTEEISWEGCSVSDCELGVVTTNDPLEALFISGNKMHGVQISNVHVMGQRGIRISNVDSLSMSNVQVDDGSIRLEALRNVKGYTLSNCVVRNSQSFKRPLEFLSNNGSSYSQVLLSNLVLDSINTSGFLTQLAGGSMDMTLCNVHNVSLQNPTVETLAGIQRFSNLKGLIVPTLLPVNVPSLAAGSVQYVSVPMTGTRLGDLFVGEGVIAHPTSQLIPAGVGGAYLHCRVSAPGVVELAFIGPLAPATRDFNFYRVN